MVNTYVVVAAVLVVLLVVMAVNNALAKRPRPAAAGGSGGDGEEDGGGSLLCKFVHHDGAVVGETVAVDGDRLILKQEGVFKAVPRAQVKPDGDDLALTGFISWDAAVAEGTAWHERSTPGAHPDVTSQLTRSEDVRAPALEAFKRRERQMSADAGEEE